jgi:hypothetical protein
MDGQRTEPDDGVSVTISIPVDEGAARTRHPDAIALDAAV